MPNNFFGDDFQTQVAEPNIVLPSAHEPKRRFVPSKWEAKLVLRIIRSMRKHPNAKAEKNTVPEAPKLLWEGEDVSGSHSHGLAYLPAPKSKTPNHEDSYNPPFEYRHDLSEDAGNVAPVAREFYDTLRKVSFAALLSFVHGSD